MHGPMYQQAKDQADKMLAAAADIYTLKKKSTEDPGFRNWTDEQKERYALPNLDDRTKMTTALALVGILQQIDLVRQESIHHGGKTPDGRAIEEAIKRIVVPTGPSQTDIHFYEVDQRRRARKQKVRDIRKKIGGFIAGS